MHGAEGLRARQDDGRLLVKLGVSVALLGITLAAFWPVREADFLWLDDHAYVTGNEIVQRGLTLDGVRWAITTFEVKNWHPLTWLSHMLDCQLFGLDPVGHHGMSVALHAINAVVLFWVLAQLTGALWPSAFVAGLFATHPLHVESVAWVSERKDLLSGLFGLLAVGAWGRWARRRSWPAYAAAVILFALGLSAKPMLVTLPFVLVLLDVWPLGRTNLWSAPGAAAQPWGRLVLEKLPLFALAAGACLLTVLAQSAAETIQPFSFIAPLFRAMNVVTSYAAYLADTVWPFELAAFYPFPRSWSLVRVIGSLALLVAISFYAWWTRRTRPYFAVGWLWYLGMLVPVIGFVQLGDQARADRYTYLPLIGIFVMIAWGAADLLPRSRWRTALYAGLGVAVLAGCTVQTRVQTAYWKDTLTLFTRALEVTRNNRLAHFFVGSVNLRNENYDVAIEHLERAATLAPYHHDSLYELAQAYHVSGDLDRALARYLAVIGRDSQHAGAYRGAGLIALQRESYRDAVTLLSAATKLDPENREAYAQLKVAVRGLQEENPDDFLFMPGAQGLLSPEDQLESILSR